MPNINTQVSPGIGALPEQFSPMGGCIVDLVGVNDARFTAQISASRMFQGWVGSLGPNQAAPDPTRAWTRIATEQFKASDIASRLGGGLQSANIRITLYDGDSGSPNPVYEAMFGAGSFPYSRWSAQPANFDFDGGTNLYIGFEDAAGNPVDCGVMGQTTTYRLDEANETIETFTGFPGVFALTDTRISTPRPPAYPQPFPVTGWFQVPADKLDELYQALCTGSLKLGMHDTTPGDQYLDFTQGLAADVVSIPLFPPKVISFVAEPTQVTGSGDVVLSWTTQNCDSVDIPGAGSGLPANGSIPVMVSAETVFNLTATGQDGTDTASLSVGWVRPLIAIQFAADQTVLNAKGATTVLRWSVENADSVTLDGIPVAATGSLVTAPFNAESTRVFVLQAAQDDTLASGIDTVSVQLVAPPIVITTPNPLPAAGTTKPHYSRQFTASGGFGNYHWSATNLPAGLAMSDGGILSGTLPITGSIDYLINVSVSSEGVINPASGVFTLSFVQAPLTITTGVLTPARELEAYSFQLQSIFGRGPKTWSLIGGSLPPGLGLSGEGVISGTPEAYGYWTLTVQVATLDEVDTREYELMVKLGWDRIDLTRHIFYRAYNPDGSLVPGLTNDPFPERGGEQVFARLAVGFSVGTDEIVLEDARVRGGGLAPQFQDIPEAAHFWDLGHLDGAPYPIGGAAVVYLPASLLERFTDVEIRAKVEALFPMGSLPVVRFMDEAGEAIL